MVPGGGSPERRDLRPGQDQLSDPYRSWIERKPSAAPNPIKPQPLPTSTARTSLALIRVRAGATALAEGQGVQRQYPWPSLSKLRWFHVIAACIR
jgi:hypothetical protein